MEDDKIARTAIAEDEEGIMDLLRLMQKENALFEVNEDKVYALLRRAWNKDCVIVGACGPVGKPVATVGLTISTAWYSDERIIVDIFTYVHPDFRRKGYAKQLTKFADKCADALGMDMTPGVSGTSDLEGKIEFYTRLYGKQIGALFLYKHKADKVEIG